MIKEYQFHCNYREIFKILSTVFFIILARTKWLWKNIQMMSSLLSYFTNANAVFIFSWKKTFNDGLKNKLFPPSKQHS